MALIGADTDELREVGAEFEQGKETVDEVITYLRALIAILRAASFFSGGASLAYAEYLETTVVPWLQKISQALGMFAKLLSSQAQAQDDTSDAGRVDLSSVPTYTTPALPAAMAPYAGPPIAGSTASTAEGAVSAGGTGSTLAGGAAAPGTTSTGSTAGLTVPGGLSTGAGTAAGSVPPATAPAALGSVGAIGSSSGIGGIGGGAGWSADAPSPGVSTAGGLGSAGGIGGGSGSGAAGVGDTAGGSTGLGSAGGIGSSATDTAGTAGDATAGSTGVTTNPSVGGGLGGATPGSGEVGTLTSGDGTPDGKDSPVGAATIGAAASGAAALGVGGAALAARAGAGAAGSIESLAASNGRGSRGADVQRLQQQLTAAGYDTSGADGRWGGNTERAFQAYRADHPVEVRPGSGYTSPDGFDYTTISGIQNTSPQFLREVEAISQRLGARPEHLLATMSFETGGRFSADVKNPGSSATGLIQFMGDTAKGLGTSTAELRQMTPLEQLPYVEKYLEPHRGRLGDLDSVYSVVLAGHQASGETPLFEAGTREYRANAPLDLNRDGTITAVEASSHPLSRMRGN